MQKSRRLPKLMKVVAAGAIAHPAVANGELIPNVIVDTSQHPDVVEMMRLHKFTADGESRTQWGRLAADRKTIVLAVDMLRPVEISFSLAFEFNRFSGTVDRLFQCKYFYLQAGSARSTSVDLSAERISIEIGAERLDPKKWEAMLIRQWRNILKKDGMSSKHAEAAARAQLVAWRKFNTLDFQNDGGDA